MLNSGIIIKPARYFPQEIHLNIYCPAATAHVPLNKPRQTQRAITSPQACDSIMVSEQNPTSTRRRKP